MRTRYVFKIKAINTIDKIRIKDIARLAGVSTGTVDRVIHNRGQVAEGRREKIQQIIEELNYKPNLLARSLASKRSFLFVTILPKFHTGAGEYWEAPINGIDKAWKEIDDYNIQVHKFYFDQFDVESYKKTIDEALILKPNAVLVSPVFREETILLASKLDKSHIPYIFIDSTIEGLNNLAYFGQNSFQSGYLAAKLLETGLMEGAKISIIKPSEFAVSNQDLMREKGFNAYFQQKGLLKKYIFSTVIYNGTNETKREEQIINNLDRNNPIAAAVVFNSRVHEIAKIIEKNKIPNIKLIGYDLIEQNESFLRNEIVSYLIAQRPEDQGYFGIMSFFNHLLLKKEIIKDNYMPIDILIAENLEYYINFNK